MSATIKVRGLSVSRSLLPMTHPLPDSVGLVICIISSLGDGFKKSVTVAIQQPFQFTVLEVGLYGNLGTSWITVPVHPCPLFGLKTLSFIIQQTLMIARNHLPITLTLMDLLDHMGVAGRTAHTLFRNLHRAYPRTRGLGRLLILEGVRLMVKLFFFLGALVALLVACGPSSVGKSEIGTYQLFSYNDHTLPAKQGTLPPRRSGDPICFLVIDSGSLTLKTNEQFRYSYKLRETCNGRLMSETEVQGTYKRQGDILLLKVSGVPPTSNRVGQLDGDKIIITETDEYDSAELVFRP